MDSTEQLRVVDPPRLPRVLAAPLAITGHLAVMVWHRLRGYTRPGTDPKRAVAASHEYNKNVIIGWRKHLQLVFGEDQSFVGKDILELGPGPDIGAGLLLLAHGANSYAAIDANPLVNRANGAFYDFVLRDLSTTLSASTLQSLRSEIRLYQEGKSERIRYICDPNFDLFAFGEASIDIAVSQAAFEHFDRVSKTMTQLSQILRHGGKLIAQVDLKTHTPPLRTLDPLSIYRIPQWFYSRTPYPGVPNRIRPYEYLQMLDDLGWSESHVVPTSVLSDEYLEGVMPGLATPFRRGEAQMKQLSVYLCASR